MGTAASSLTVDNARRYTVDEYLTLERQAEERSFYLDGRIVAMAGESAAHADITVNLTGLLFNHFKGTSCRVRVQDTKGRSGIAPLQGTLRQGMFSYSDLVVVCEDVEFHDAFKEVILNPRVIFEILSPNMESFDRGEKFHRYRIRNISLHDYVLVSQDKPIIEVFSAQSDKSWVLRFYEGVKASAEIPSISCTIKLREVYDRIPFETSENADGEFEFTN